MRDFWIWLRAWAWTRPSAPFWISIVWEFAYALLIVGVWELGWWIARLLVEVPK